MKIKKIVRGLISYIPILKLILPKKRTGGSDNPNYCIDLYNKHKEKLISNGCNHPFKNLGEIGPGDSLGLGIVALLDKTECYFGMDSTPFANQNNNISIFHGICNILKKDNFPIKSTTEAKVLESLMNSAHPNSLIKYYAPWWKNINIEKESLDVIISTAVMEHVVDLKDSYLKQFQWLKHGGYICHIIDYTAHEFSERWFEHWYYGDFIWKVLMHGRGFPINRMPHSYHIKCLQDAGFTIISTEIKKHQKIASLRKMSKSIANIFETQDLSIKGSTIVARKE